MRNQTHLRTHTHTNRISDMKKKIFTWSSKKYYFGAISFWYHASRKTKGFSESALSATCFKARNISANVLTPSRVAVKDRDAVVLTPEGGLGVINSSIEFTDLFLFFFSNL